MAKKSVVRIRESRQITDARHNLKVLLIVQARMGSTRLPGKTMMPLEGRPLLGFLIERLLRTKYVDQIVVATSNDEKDDAIAEYCNTLHVACYRGSEEDVLSRYQEAAAKYKGDVIVRVTADCPLIDPVVIDHIIERFLTSDPDCDYVSNTLERTYPRGMDTEVFSSHVLQESAKKAKLPAEREHVTPYIYSQPERFSIQQVKLEESYAQHRWTVDTAEDLTLVSKLAGELYSVKPDFELEDLLEVIKVHPEWEKINSGIVQK